MYFVFIKVEEGFDLLAEFNSLEEATSMIESLDKSKEYRIELKNGSNSEIVEA